MFCAVFSLNGGSLPAAASEASGDEKTEQDKYKQVATEAAQAWLEYLRATQQDATAAKKHCLQIVSAEQCQ